MIKVTHSKASRIYLSPPHMTGREQQFINRAFESNWIAPLGPNVDAFESEIAQYVRVNEAVVVSSGTAAIHLALLLLDVKKGDTVFCSSLTFVASANPILYQQAEPVFIDSDFDSWNMSPQALERALIEAKKSNKLPKAVIVVNIYGQSAKMDKIMDLCATFNVPIIEDAAESLGSLYRGQASGTFGRFGIYSFNGNKIITTSGGGALVTNDHEAAHNARFLATQAKDNCRYYQHSYLGFNYRMSNVLAGIGRAQLEVIEERVLQKRTIYNTYYTHLNDVPGVSFMPELPGTRSNRWLTTLTIDENIIGRSSEHIINALTEKNIEARPVWKPLHLQPLYKGCLYYSHDKGVDVSKTLADTGLCLPSGTSLSEEEQWRVINALKNSMLSHNYVQKDVLNIDDEAPTNT